MQANKRVTPSRQPVKTATRAAPVARKAVPAKAPVRSAAPAKKLVAQRPVRVPVSTRKQVKTGFQCEPSDEPCTKSQIDLSGCETSTTLPCIVLAANILNGAVINDSLVDKSFKPTEGPAPSVQACASTSCVNEDGSPGSIVSVIIIGDTPLTVDNKVYSISRIYKVTDSCGNTALFTYTVNFTISDGEGPEIKIEPLIGTNGLVACSPGTNPTCTAGLPGLPDNCECECVFLDVCRPSEAEIDYALGTATAAGCTPEHDVEVHVDDTGPFPDGECYKYKIRTFTAADECCNVSTKCRVVKWVDEATDPELKVSPTIDELLTEFPGSEPCTADENPDAKCECIDLGCNPMKFFSPPSDYPDNIDGLVDYVLGKGTATDTCSGVRQVCKKTKRRVGNCCSFSQKRIFTASDPCGNDVRVCRVVIWKEDDTAPIIQCASDKVVPCGTSLEDAVALFDTPDAFDGCDGCSQAVQDPDKDDYVDYNPETGAILSVTRYWIAIDTCNNEGFGEQTIFFDCDTVRCDPKVVAKGCSREFFGNSTGGLKKWDQITDDIVEKINKEIIVKLAFDQPQLLFTQGTSFFYYFGVVEGISRCGVPTSTTMFEAINLDGEGCNPLAAQGVAAMLNMAAFGSAYQIPGYPEINTLQKLFLAIRAGFASCVCTDLAAALAIANNREGPQGIYCSSIPEASETVVPKNLRLRAQPSPKKIVKPAPKKVVKPAPKKVAVKPAPKKQLRKTFVPGNAQ